MIKIKKNFKSPDHVERQSFTAKNDQNKGSRHESKNDYRRKTKHNNKLGD